jgi:hypothetical protein
MPDETPAYFFGASSFLGLHFSQVLPSFLAFTQHLWSHSLPAALALSQQDSADAKLMLPKRANAAMTALIDFMFLPFLTTSYAAVLSLLLKSTNPQATQP